jgi:A-factor type gamma-butyrolactone 1'-reductase (1S-forming)
MTDWKQKVVFVAGVGSGLGSALVSLLGGAGAAVVGVARSQASLDRLGTIAQRTGWKFRGVRADLSVQSEVDAAVQLTEREFGPIDGVSINAGHWVEGDTLLHRMTDLEWTDGLKDNLEAYYRVGRATLPLLIDRGRGAIVLVSAAERVRWDGNPSYCVAKGGILELTRKLSRDYRQFGIRVNAVLPGTMEHEVDPGSPPPENTPLALRDRSGVGAWEVARTIRYLLSDSSRWVTGTLLTVDGGYSLRGKAPEAPEAGS